MYFPYLFELIRNVFTFASLLSIVIFSDIITNMQAYFNTVIRGTPTLTLLLANRISKLNILSGFHNFLPTQISRDENISVAYKAVNLSRLDINDESVQTVCSSYRLLLICWAHCQLLQHVLKGKVVILDKRMIEQP